MRRPVEDLGLFYTTPEGRVVQSMVSRKLSEAWPDVAGLDVLGLGYTTPFLDMFNTARRVISAMPAAQGAEIWPEELKSRTVLVDEYNTPFPSGLFDRLFLMHSLEEASNASGLLYEASRLMAPNGRMILAVVARGGLWTHAERTPFGHGQPFSRSQLEAILRNAELEPVAWSHALYVPPMRSMLRWAQMFENWAPKIWPYPGGLILIEACRRSVRVPVRGAAVSVIDELRDVLGVKAPTPAANFEGISRVKNTDKA
ncbi:MAG: methyltransferase domain-containing protein [Asticcacaulis sp.]